MPVASCGRRSPYYAGVYQPTACSHKADLARFLMNELLAAIAESHAGSAETKGLGSICRQDKLNRDLFPTSPLTTGLQQRTLTCERGRSLELDIERRDLGADLAVCVFHRSQIGHGLCQVESAVGGVPRFAGQLIKFLL